MDVNLGSEPWPGAAEWLVGESTTLGVVHHGVDSLTDDELAAAIRRRVREICKHRPADRAADCAIDRKYLLVLCDETFRRWNHGRAQLSRHLP